MPQIGPMEILVVAALALIVFGPEKLPEIARTVGRTASQLRRMANEVRAEFDADVEDEQDVQIHEEEEGDDPPPPPREAT